MKRPAFRAYEPLNALKRFADRVWIVDGPEIGFQVAPGLELPAPTRMTVVELENGVWVHSPIALDDELAAAVERLGPIRWLVAPNTVHYWWAPEWKARFPEAQLLASPGLRSWAKRPLPIDAVIRPDLRPGWGAAIDHLVVRGDRLTEVAFLHRPSRTLILTDLIEDFERERARRPRLRALLKITGRTSCSTPRDVRLAFIRHRKAIREAAEQMIAWAPERIVIAHGRCVEMDGTTALERAFAWARPASAD